MSQAHVAYYSTVLLFLQKSTTVFECIFFRFEYPLSSLLFASPFLLKTETTTVQRKGHELEEVRVRNYE